MRSHHRRATAPSRARYCGGPLHPAVPDLLCAEPAVRVDVSALRTALVFGFAAGGAPEVFDEVIAGARLPASTWDRSDFARDVYLDDLVSRCLPVRIGGKTFPACTRYIARVLAEPPRARADVETRRAVLSELASGDRRAELEKVYLSIVRLRSLLCTARALSQRGRRVEVIRAAREVFETLAASFDGAKSALSRLRAFGAEVVAGEAHENQNCDEAHGEQHRDDDLDEILQNLKIPIQSDSPPTGARCRSSAYARTPRTRSTSAPSSAF